MRRRVGPLRAALLGTGVALAASLAGAAPAQSQGTSGTCRVAAAPSGTPSGVIDATGICQTARDLFAFVSPQVGVAVSGGNPLPGDAGSLGGFGTRALSLRVVGVEGWLPRNRVPLDFGNRAGDFGAARTIVPVPAADLALGLFPGVPFGLTNVGGVDLLLGATILPSLSRNAFELDPENGGLGWSYGLRVGALQESSVVPGVSVSWQRRALPRTDFAYRSGNDTLLVEGATVRSDALRLIISKRLALFGLAAGVGQDRIVSTSTMSGVINDQINGTPVRQAVSLSGLRGSTRRHTAFVNASFSLLVVRVVGEYGWSSAGTITSTVNSFGGRQANEGYRFGSLGLTARF
jgi:hypothetical protein